MELPTLRCFMLYWVPGMFTDINTPSAMGIPKLRRLRARPFSQGQPWTRSLNYIVSTCRESVALIRRHSLTNEADWRMYASLNCDIIGSDKGLSPVRCQANIWTNARILLIGHLGTNFSEILIGVQTFSFKKFLFEYVVCKMASILSRPQWYKKTAFDW